MRGAIFGFGERIAMMRAEKRHYQRQLRPCLRRGVGDADRITPATFTVATVLLWAFHNGATGRCDPSYETIAARAGVARSTVGLALAALKKLGLLDWDNRIVRVATGRTDLLGEPEHEVKLTSNAYRFLIAFRRFTNRTVTGTLNYKSSSVDAPNRSVDKPPQPGSALEAALRSLGAAVAGKAAPA